MFQAVRSVPCKIHTLISYIQNNKKLPQQREASFFSWQYNSLWVFAWPTILFNASLSIVIFLQFWTFFFPGSILTSSSHITLSLPNLLTATGLHSLFFSLPILTIHWIHLILCVFIYLQVYQQIYFISSYSPTPTLIFFGPNICLITSVSNTLNCRSMQAANRSSHCIQGKKWMIVHKCSTVGCHCKISTKCGQLPTCEWNFRLHNMQVISWIELAASQGLSYKCL